jgi:hypothetical protein
MMTKLLSQEAKVGTRNFSPHLRNSAILRTTNSIAELRTKKSCGTAIADLQNLTSTIPQLSAVTGQFPYFPYNNLSQWKQKLALKGQ